LSTPETTFAELVATSVTALKYMLETDEQAVRYTLDKLQNPPRNEGDDRIFVSAVDEKSIAAAISAIRDGKAPDLYFWIGFIERVGGPTEFTRKYRDQQQQIASQNLGLVWQMARSMIRKYGQRWELEEFVSEGYVGLLRSVELFDPSRDFKFSTYAMTWIRQFINRFILKNLSLTHMPENVISDRMKKGVFKDAISIDYEDNSEDGDNSIQIESKCPAPDRNQEATEEAQKLGEFLNRLEGRERQIIALRYGLGGGPTMTLKEVGEVIGISRQRVLQLEGRAIRKLKYMGGSL